MAFALPSLMEAGHMALSNGPGIAFLFFVQQGRGSLFLLMPV